MRTVLLDKSYHRLFLVVILFHFAIKGSSQTPYNLVSDYNHHQQNPFTLIEANDTVFIVGTVLEKGLDVRECKTFIAKYDKQGQYLDHLILSLIHI